MANLLNAKQTTLRERVVVSGVGVHSGKPVEMILHPADANTGITFLRTNREKGTELEIKGTYQSVIDTRLCTIIGHPEKGMIATIEHLMAALVGYGVDNVLVEVDADEVPVMDGSSRAYIDAIDQVGLKDLSAPRRYIRVLKPVRVQNGDSVGELLPHDGTRFDVTIDFDCETIGVQTFNEEMTPSVFKRDVSLARTFGFMSDVERLWAAGYALGSSLENSVVIGDDQKIVNPDGLRYEDEFVRHKTLDAVGDLALAGAQLLAHFRSYKGGHKLNFNMLEALFADDSNWEWVEASITKRNAARVDVSHANSSIQAAMGPETN
ncbi:UDP-3-O-acyl-N-acetylglucosamine deacetylase [Cohaesibacter sp. CAU 1516]|uniref:UDP-3-O-acyl-N-acetylglucosamine deacetylase n=1 Tax=Cohaesibacter sp. CAU 1516 TaxID=2576038 RepID=UPI0010FD73A7|nr:UDP-3-O-acyl-N-acetylglucosamine deacetylase [Cohaesibacter sp. CAU 1516]TLP48448.1 UDP-3-O-acyl-N-acetylglucosamine deacetylase [Cohaesibacter sp. CAU 1516]